ncbi:MAG TPA: translation initiation factor IF-2 associated domain-containing protein, partial [Thermohalobaculum sp.]|nr:translation initiation factor IF-2 associated domain-containing protein [Thermohalobaculum sp.]
MNDTDSGDNKGGRRAPSRGGGTVRGSVRQSFSHGRSHAVVVETKKRRLVTPPDGAKPAGTGTITLKPAAPKPAAAPAATPETEVARKAPKPAAKAVARDTPEETRDAEKKRPAILRTLSEEEYSRRLEALKQARKDDEVRRQREAEEARLREAEEARRRAEDEAKRKAEEAEAATRRQVSESETETETETETEAAAAAETEAETGAGAETQAAEE